MAFPQNFERLDATDLPAEFPAESADLNVLKACNNNDLDTDLGVEDINSVFGKCGVHSTKELFGKVTRDTSCLLVHTPDAVRVEQVHGPIDATRLRSLLRCRNFEMVPCTVGVGNTKIELWLDEDGAYEKQPNMLAIALLGNQVHGGMLHGNVLVVKTGTIP